jgi:glucose-1-phosphate thymidylyltransferase
MPNKISLIIPAAGWATRMRPQTWTKPKPLVSVAGRTVLDHLLDSFHTLPDPQAVETVIIFSPGVGAEQIPPYMKEQYPQRKVSFVLQSEMKGQAHALLLARQHLAGPVIVCFSDTLLEADFSILGGADVPCIAWVKTVPDPRRFGVAEVDEHGSVTRLVEKPISDENKRVVVGCYYFPEGRDLLSAIEEQIRSGRSMRGEYYLTETINLMLERGMKMRTAEADAWLDTGTIEATLETNRHLLARLPASLPDYLDEQACRKLGLKIVPPVAIHATSIINQATIGPNASIGAGCIISNARVADSILEAGVTLQDIALQGCFIGRRTVVKGRRAEDPPVKLNLGDDCSLDLK